MFKSSSLLILSIIVSFSSFGCQSNSNSNSAQVNDNSVQSIVVANSDNADSRQAKLPNPNPQLEELLINPQTTDANIDDWLEPHYVVTDKSAPSNGKLFVFLSGSNGIPERQKLITQQAAKLGYDAINLRYPNSGSVGRMCGKARVNNCHSDIRQEVFSGMDESPLIEVNSANSLENRLVKLLKYMKWQEYLQGDNPNWQKIVIAGHSQGGGTAFFIAKQHLVAKAIAFSAPADFNRKTKDSASWLKDSSKTPPDRYYGFVHTQDRGLEKIVQAWDLLGLNQFSQPVNVDQQNYPYNNSHQLFTSASNIKKDKYHGSVVVDNLTPISPDGTPVFESVWNYLLE